MSTSDRAARAALVVVAGALLVFGVSSIARAQRPQPRVGFGAESPPLFGIPITPYPGATVTIDSRLFFRQPLPQPFRRPPRREPFRNVPGTGGYPYGGYSNGGYSNGGYSNGGYSNGGYSNGGYPSGGYSYGGYPYYPTDGYGYGYGYGYGCGGVYDTNGRPLYDCYGNGNGNGNGYGYGYGCGSASYDTNGRPLSDCSNMSAPRQNDYPLGTPDLSGSPYVVGDSGVMIVTFGRGDQRMVPSCTALAAERTPDGRLRTIFYRPPADGLILRAGQRGQVIGTPAVGTSSCYTTNSFGRVVLDY